jgi:hypothetical protein
VCTELFEPEEVAAIERETNVIDVSADLCLSGICNSVRLSNTILNASHIMSLKAGTKEYADEIAKNRRLEDIGAESAMEELPQPVGIPQGRRSALLHGDAPQPPLLRLQLV